VGTRVVGKEGRSRRVATPSEPGSRYYGSSSFDLQEEERKRQPEEG
jgi:hypothetical protein